MGESITYSTEFNPTITSVEVTDETVVDMPNDSEVSIVAYDLNGNETKGYNTGYKLLVNDTMTYLPVNITCLLSGSKIYAKILDKNKISKIVVQYYNLTKQTVLELLVPKSHSYYMSGNFVLMSFKDGQKSVIRRMRMGVDSDLLKIKVNGEDATSSNLPSQYSGNGRDSKNDLLFHFDINEKYFVGRDGSVMCAGIENFVFRYT